MSKLTDVMYKWGYPITSVLRALGDVIKNIFVGKDGHSLQTITSTIEKVKEIESSALGDAAKYTALAKIITSEQEYGTQLVKDWRSLVMLTSLVCIVLFFFGFASHHLFGPLPPLVEKFCQFIEIGLGLAIPTSGVMSVMHNNNLASVANKVIHSAHELNMKDRDNEEDDTSTDTK